LIVSTGVYCCARCDIRGCCW